MLPPGFDNLGPADVSHAISLIPVKGARLLARVMYADQKSFAPELEHELLQVIKRVAKRRKWHNISPLKKMTAIAVTVYCAAERCHKCKGIGERKWGAKIIHCPRCKVRLEGKVEKGHGWQRVYHSDIAHELGVSQEQFSRTWKRRYGLALDILMRWDGRCWNGLSRAIREKS